MNWDSVRRNWPGLLIGFIGLLWGVYSHVASRSYREPVFLEDSTRMRILDRERVDEAPIQVFDNEGEEITTDLTAVRFYFWNDGKRPIHREDVLKPIRINLLQENTDILDFHFLKTSRDVTELSLERAPSSPAHGLNVSFSILEQNDGGVGQIIYAGPPDTNLELSGVIEGVDSLTVSRNQDWNALYYVLATLTVIYFLGGWFFGTLAATKSNVKGQGRYQEIFLGLLPIRVRKFHAQFPRSFLKYMAIISGITAMILLFILIGTGGFWGQGVSITPPEELHVASE